MNAPDGNDSNQAEPPHQTKRAHSQLTNDSEVEEIDPEIGTESPLNRTTKRACLHTQHAASSSTHLADESTGDNYSPPCSVELIKEVATTSAGEGTSAQSYFENHSSSESDDDEDLFNIDEDRSLLVNEDTNTAALRTTNEATGGSIRQSDEANVITDDEDDQNRRNHRLNSVISEQNSQAGSNAELNFTRSRYRDNVHRGYLSHNTRSHGPVSHNNQYQHYHHGLPANNSHNYRCNQFQRHNNQRFRACNAHANRPSDSRLDQAFANFTNSRLAGGQQQQGNNNGYEFCANEFLPSNQQVSLAAVSNQRSTNAPHEQTNDEANSFADSFSFINEPRQDTNQRHQSPRYNNMSTATSSSLANDMNCLSSSYVPPNAQLSYLPRRTSTAHLIQNSRNNGAASSNHHHQFDQLEDHVQHQQPRYIPSSMGARNSTNQTHANSCGSGNGNNNNSSRNYHYHNPVNMHANFTRLWHEQNNQMEMNRNANLHRRYLRLILFDHYCFKIKPTNFGRNE